jgi:hypothetical protein
MGDEIERIKHQLDSLRNTVNRYGDSRGTTENLDAYDERTELPGNLSNRMSPIVGFSSRDEYADVLNNN